MPARGQNQKVTATTTSQSLTINRDNKSLRVVNAGAVVAYFVTWDSTRETGGRTCTAADTPLGVAGSSSDSLVITKPAEHDRIAYLADSTTAVMHFQPGEGGN